MYRTIGLSCLFLFAWLVVSAQEDTRIQVHMDANVKICVGEKIVLTCPDSIPARKVLTYEWFEYRGANDSVMISTGRSVTVQPLRETSYRLIIQYLDMKNNLIRYGDFEGIPDGPGGLFPNQDSLPFKTDYTWTAAGGDRALWPEGVFKFAANSNTYHFHFFDRKDHTTGKGKMMVINGHPLKNAKVWQQNITGIRPGTEYAFSVWGMNVSTGAKPRFQFSISKDDNYNVVGGMYETFSPKNDWTSLFRMWKALVGWGTNACITLIDQTTERSGNDFAVDDFVFAPVLNLTGKITLQLIPRFNMDKMADRDVCAGTDVNVQPVIYGEANVYEWYKDGVKLDGKNTLNLLLNKVKRDDSGVYECKVSGGVCGEGSGRFTLAVQDSLILEPLNNLDVCRANEAFWRVVVKEGHAERYQWSQPAQAQNWVGQYSDGYLKQQVVAADSGIYTCTVSSKCGNRLVSARLGVYPDIEVVEISKGGTYCPGTSVTMTGKINRPAIFSWIWGQESGNIRLEFSDTLVTIPDGTDITYTFFVNDTLCRKSLAPVVQLFLKDTLKSLTLEDERTVCENSNVTVSPEARGGENLVWSWEGPHGFVSAVKVLKIDAFRKEQSGFYRLTVTDDCGNSLTDSINITVIEEFGSPVISGDLNVCLGENGELRVVGGVNGLKYEWTTPTGRKVLSSVLTLNRIRAQDTGLYVCRLTSVCGNHFDLQTHVSLYPPVSVEAPDRPLEVCEGERVEFTVTVRPEEHYVWMRNGVQVGTADRSYVIAAATAADDGVFECVVSSPCGESKILRYVLVVHKTTVITGKSDDFYVTPGANVNMFVRAEGSDLTYQWRKVGGGNVGLGDPSLVYDAVTLENAGTYICTVTGRCGRAEATIRLNVGDFNEVTADQQVFLCVGSAYSYTAALRPAGCTQTANLVYSWKGPDGREVSNTKALVLSDVTTATAGVYTCTIAGTCGTATLRLTATVYENPVLSVTPAADTLCEGESVNMSAAVNANAGNYMFEWRHEGLLLGTTVEQHIIRDVTLSDAGQYVCKVSAHCGEDRDTVRLTVRKGLKILNRPADLTLCKGNAAELKVEASGDSVVYAWGGPVAGEWSAPDTAVYRNGSVSQDATGQYRCVVSSRCGTDTLYVRVDVEKDLELVSRTPNLAACIGEKDVTLWARVNLDGARWIWTFPDGRIFTTPEVPLDPITTADRGRYVFQIESPRGCSVLKDSIGIGVYNEPGPLTVSPADAFVCEGSVARFEAAMPGTEVVYSWMGPGRFTADTAIIIVEDVTMAKTGSYQVIARDICRHERVAAVNLSLNEELDRLTISSDTAVCLFSDVKFTVGGGYPGMSYTWFFNGNQVGTDAVLKLDNVEERDAGEYTCRIGNTCGTVEKTVRLTILQPLEFSLVTPAYIEACIGETVVFGVQADGTHVEYRWQKTGTDVGTMDSLLVLSDIEAWEGGIYTCSISSVCGTEDAEFELKVKPQTRITGRSPDKYVSMNDSLQLFIITEGVHNTFEWKKEENVIGRDSVLNIPDVGSVVRDVVYQAKAEGDCGIDSVSFLLRIGDYIHVPILGGEADTICEGSNYAYAAELVPYGCYGGEPVSYLWKKVEGGTEIEIESDMTSALFKIKEATPVDTGLYRCVIKYRGCPIDGGDTLHVRDTLFELRLAMIEVPKLISISPKDTTVTEGFEHRIKVEAGGDVIFYGWQKDDTVALPQKGTSLQFLPVKFEDAGVYRVTIENKCSRVSATSRLKVTQKTVIISPMDNTVGVCRSSDTTLRVDAIGTNLIYRWYAEGRLMASSRHNEYTLRNVDKAIKISCVVEGKGGTDTCSFRVSVLELPKVAVDGAVLICRSAESYLQEYTAVSPQTDELMWNWQLNKGMIRSQAGKPQVEVYWNGEDGAAVTVTAVSRNTGCSARSTLAVGYVSLPEVWLDLPETVGYCIDSLVLNRAWPLGGAFVSEGDTIHALGFYVKDKRYEVKYVYTDPLTCCSNEALQRLDIDVEPKIRLAKRNDTTGVCRPLTLAVASHTPGTITWKGSGLYLDTTDLLNPLFVPEEADAEHVYYEATVTDAYDCEASDYTRIRVVYLPRVTAMRDTVIGNCGEEPVDLTLNAQYITSYFDRMAWLPADQVELQADYSGKVSDMFPGKNVFVVEVYDVFGCTGEDSVGVTLSTGPDVADREICLGDSIRVDQSGYIDFNWSDGYTLPQRLITQVGTDTLWVKDEFGCEGTAVYTVRSLPETNLVDTFLLRGHRLELPLELNPDYGPYDIVWQDGSAVIVYIAEREGEYWVRVTDNIGCTVTDTARLTFIEGIYAPNAFLPESHGENSRFYLKEVNFIGDFEMYIYNRWGELIFKTNEIGFNGGWNGTFNGKKCDVGTYVWVAFNNGKRLGRGTVTLIK